MADSVVEPIHQHPGAVPEIGRVGCVQQASDGAATAVTDEATGTELAVAGHFRSAGHLQPGDTVGYMNTPDGALIVDRLRREGEGPSADIQEENGHVVVSAGQSLTLMAGGSRLEISADGRIRIDGNEVQQNAHGRLALRAPSVELN